jgi:hypothetical protein
VREHSPTSFLTPSIILLHPSLHFAVTVPVGLDRLAPPIFVADEVSVVHHNNNTDMVPQPGPVRRWTFDGDNDVLNGRLDWVYQEEIYGRGEYGGYWWSPDSQSLAYLRLDEAAIRPYTVRAVGERCMHLTRRAVGERCMHVITRLFAALVVAFAHVCFCNDTSCRGATLRARRSSHPLICCPRRCLCSRVVLQSFF